MKGSEYSVNAHDDVGIESNVVAIDTEVFLDRIQDATHQIPPFQGQVSFGVLSVGFEGTRREASP